MSTARVVAAATELREADDAHQQLCERRRAANERRPLFDPSASFSSGGFKAAPDPEGDAVIARLRSAWKELREALDAMDVNADQGNSAKRPSLQAEPAAEGQTQRAGVDLTEPMRRALYELAVFHDVWAAHDDDESHRPAWHATQAALLRTIAMSGGWRPER